MVSSESVRSSEDEDKKDIRFSCEGKCRLCPFPGANCAKEELKSEGEKNA